MTNQAVRPPAPGTCSCTCFKCRPVAGPPSHCHNNGNGCNW